MDTGRFDALREAFRRRSGQQPSSTGMIGGAGVANEVTASNPLASMALANPSLSAPGQPQNMSTMGMNQLKQSQPGEAELIIKALINRLKMLAPQGQALA